jgi:hypothetical protein
MFHVKHLRWSFAVKSFTPWGERFHPCARGNDLVYGRLAPSRPANEVVEERKTIFFTETS